MDIENDSSLIPKEISQNDIKYAWHYTSAQGLYGILNDKCFHVTNALFLNDPTEIEYSKNLLLQAIKKYYEHPQYNEIADLILNMHIRSKIWEHYVLSLSLNDDSLPMWQYYGKNGYALKLDIDKLFKISFVKNIPVDTERTDMTTMGEVIYNVKHQLASLDRNLSKIFNTNRENKSDLHRLIYDFINDFETNRLFYKDSAYSNEKELRYLFSLNNEDANASSLFKLSRNGMLVPYIVVDILEIWDIITEIKIHPLMDEDLTKNGIKRFLKHNGTENIKITKSKVPFREL